MRCQCSSKHRYGDPAGNSFAQLLRSACQAACLLLAALVAAPKCIALTRTRSGHN